MIAIIFMILFIILFLLATTFLFISNDYWLKRYKKLENDYNATKIALYDIYYNARKVDSTPFTRVTISKIAKLFKDFII